MEEKKLDLNSIIGFVLIFAILIFMMWQKRPTPEELAEQEKAKQEQVDAAKTAEEAKKVDQTTAVTTAQDFTQAKDSAQIVALTNKIGAFSHSAVSAKDQPDTFTVSNDVLDLTFSKKGGHLSEVKLKQFVDFDSIPIHLVKDNNATFNVNLSTTDNRILDTKNLPFHSTVTKSGDNTIVSMKLKTSETNFLEYNYTISHKT